MPRIDYFLSPVSPYTYLAGTRPEAVAARHGMTLAYKPVDMQVLFDRTGGIRLPDRHESRKQYRLQELARQAAKTGMRLNLKPKFWPANGAPASYAIIAAITAANKAGSGDVGGLVHAFTRALWAEERDIADDGEIRAILAAQGFDPAIADRHMLAAAETYAANLEEAVARGVFGAPFFITEGDERFWGQDRLDDLDAHLSGRL